MPDAQVIQVTIDRENHSLTLDRSEVAIGAGDFVQWDFNGLAVDELAYIRFSPPSGVFGPFQSLEPSSFHVFGTGNNGGPAAYPYTALVLNNDGVLASSSGSHTILNTSLDVNASPQVTVTFQPGSPPALLVEPETLQLQPGRPALWTIRGVPAGLFLTFAFEGPDTMIGPFSSFAVLHGVNAAPVAVGANFSLPTGTTSTQYHLRLRDEAGNVIAGDDPVIDLLGSPPGT